MNLLQTIHSTVAMLPLPPFNDTVRGLTLLISIASVSYMAIQQIPVPEFYLLFVATYNGYYFGHQQARMAYQQRKDTPE